MPFHRHAAFTLIELLVVISIIAVLASLLLPSLTAVRGQARKSVCRSNLKQLAIGLNSYLIDWEGWLMRASPRNDAGIPAGDVENWGQRLAVFMEIRAVVEPVASRSQLGIFNCPENALQRRQMGAGSGQAELSYAGNAWGDYRTVPATGIESPWDGQFFGGFVASYSHKEDLVAIYDGTYCRTDVSGLDNGAGSVPSIGIGLGNIYYRHQNRINVLYADFHVGDLAVIRPRCAFLGGMPGRAGSYANGRSWFALD